jgi:hypothetical protein
MNHALFKNQGQGFSFLITIMHDVNLKIKNPWTHKQDRIQQKNIKIILIENSFQ